MNIRKTLPIELELDRLVRRKDEFMGMPYETRIKDYRYNKLMKRIDKMAREIKVIKLL